MASKKQNLHYVRGLFDEDDFLHVLASYILDARGYSPEGMRKISLMTVIKNAKNRNPKRQFRIEIVFSGEPQKI